MIKTKKRRLLEGLLVCPCEVEVAEIMLPLEDGGERGVDGRVVSFAIVLARWIISFTAVAVLKVAFF